MYKEFKIIVQFSNDYECIDKYDIFDYLSQKNKWIEMLKVEELCEFTDDEMKGFRK